MATQPVHIDVAIEVVCDECGTPLEADLTADTLHVKPCENCLEAEFDEGHKDGEE